MALPFLNIYHIFLRWTCEINPTDLGTVPPAVSGQLSLFFAWSCQRRPWCDPSPLWHKLICLLVRPICISGGLIFTGCKYAAGGLELLPLSLQRWPVWRLVDWPPTQTCTHVLTTKAQARGLSPSYDLDGISHVAARTTQQISDKFEGSGVL